jgi:hypothetical protein
MSLIHSTETAEITTNMCFSPWISMKIFSINLRIHFDFFSLPLDQVYKFRSETIFVGAFLSVHVRSPKYFSLHCRQKTFYLFGKLFLHHRKMILFLPSLLSFFQRDAYIEFFISSNIVLMRTKEKRNKWKSHLTKVFRRAKEGGRDHHVSVLEQ